MEGPVNLVEGCASQDCGQTTLADHQVLVSALRRRAVLFYELVSGCCNPAKVPLRQPGGLMSHCHGNFAGPASLFSAILQTKQDSAYSDSL